MTAVSDIIAQPLLPVELIAALALLAAVSIGLALWRRLKGAWLRLGAALALIIGLLDPAAVEEQRDNLSDVALLVVDESASQNIEDRAEMTRAAAEAIATQIGAMAGESGAEPAPGQTGGVELRTIRVPGDGAEGTKLLSALAEATADIPAGRLAGAVLVTDGAVTDGERVLKAFSGDTPPPVHVLLTGREDEFDRRVVVENAPGFGLVGDEVRVRFRIDETGASPASLAPPRVTIYVDGEPSRITVAPIGRLMEVRLDITHGGSNVVEIRAETTPGELTDRNNAAAFTINGVRDRLRVLLVSGEPHAGERTWRNLLKSDPSVDLVHFTILRPPSKLNYAPVNELALIPFPTRELFEEKLEEFDLIVFDRYRRWGILERRYISNISQYVRDGGAVLVSSGPAFAGLDSMYRTPLAEVLPAEPTSDVIETAFLPTPTELGDRHPVTRDLPGRAGPGGTPSWGRWFRQVEVAALSGDVIMEGAEERPLLILDRVGDGRVALMASDHAWLWSRGYDGGGPQAELLRRLAHWLMKEPELEEEALTAEPVDGGFEVERRSLAPGAKHIVSVSPEGARTELSLSPAGPGLWRGVVETEELGLHRIFDADNSEIGDPPREPLSAVAVVGPPSPREFANPISTPDNLAGLVEGTRGAMIRLKEDGAPDVRRVREGRAAEGAGWIGLTRREAYSVAGVSLSPLAPSWILFAIAALLAVAAWRVEGRLGKPR
ncbi:MAG: hypothetical protein KTR21_05930 [Rhodobacteraceae bacterium]|nr:hypothetical protein [Paracoccaceae bacterium]